MVRLCGMFFCPPKHVILDTRILKFTVGFLYSVQKVHEPDYRQMVNSTKKKKFYFVRAVRIFIMVARCSKYDFRNLGIIWDRNRWSEIFSPKIFSSKKHPYFFFRNSFRDLKNFLCKSQRKIFKSLKDCSILVRNSQFSPLPPIYQGVYLSAQMELGGLLGHFWTLN